MAGSDVEERWSQGVGRSTWSDNLSEQRGQGCCVEGDTEFTWDSSIAEFSDVSQVSPEDLRCVANAKYTLDF